MSPNPCQFGFALKCNAYKAIPNMQATAPADLLKLISCQCEGICDTLRCGCRKNNVKCISACGYCHGVTCKNGVQNDNEEFVNDASGYLDD